jgi:hypothetical protein
VKPNVNTYHMQRRSLLLTGATLGLAGCTAPGTNWLDLTLPPAPDSSILKVGIGIAVIRINLTQLGSGQPPPIRLTINNRPSIGFASGLFTLKSGTNFHVVALTPGGYQWKEIYMGNYGSVFRDDFVFRSVERQVTYVGDVDITLDWSAKTYRLGFVDRSRIAEAAFSASYPLMSTAHRMVSELTKGLRV